MQNLAAVRLWGQLVGALAYDPLTRLSTFEYAPDWLNQGVEIAPLKMPLSPRKYQFRTKRRNLSGAPGGLFRYLAGRFWQCSYRQLARQEGS